MKVCMLLIVAIVGGASVSGAVGADKIDPLIQSIVDLQKENVEKLKSGRMRVEWSVDRPKGFSNQGEAVVTWNGPLSMVSANRGVIVEMEGDIRRVERWVMGPGYSVIYFPDKNKAGVWVGRLPPTALRRVTMLRPDQVWYRIHRKDDLAIERLLTSGFSADRRKQQSTLVTSGIVDEGGGNYLYEREYAKGEKWIVSTSTERGGGVTEFKIDWEENDEVTTRWHDEFTWEEHSSGAWVVKSMRSRWYREGDLVNHVQSVVMEFSEIEIDPEGKAFRVDLDDLKLREETKLFEMYGEMEIQAHHPRCLRSLIEPGITRNVDGMLPAHFMEIPAHWKVGNSLAKTRK